MGCSLCSGRRGDGFDSHGQGARGLDSAKWQSVDTLWVRYEREGRVCCLQRLPGLPGLKSPREGGLRLARLPLHMVLLGWARHGPFQLEPLRAVGAAPAEWPPACQETLPPPGSCSQDGSSTVFVMVTHVAFQLQEREAVPIAQPPSEPGMVWAGSWCPQEPRAGPTWETGARWSIGASGQGADGGGRCCLQ